jgi:hypothetical protein
MVFCTSIEQTVEQLILRQTMMRAYARQNRSQRADAKRVMIGGNVVFAISLCAQTNGLPV